MKKTKVEKCNKCQDLEIEINTQGSREQNTLFQL